MVHCLEAPLCLSINTNGVNLCKSNIQFTHRVSVFVKCSIARLKPDGTRWRTGGEVKGKLANGVGSLYSHTTSERGVSSITNADAHNSAASSWLNWLPRRFKWTRPFRRKTKSVSARVPPGFKRAILSICSSSFSSSSSPSHEKLCTTMNFLLKSST